MIITTLRIKVPADKKFETLKIMRSLLGPVRVKRGCINSWVYEDKEEENFLVLMEEWDSEENLNHHISSKEYRKVLALMDMSTEAPEIKFSTVSHTSGLEAVHKILTHHSS